MLDVVSIRALRAGPTAGQVIQRLKLALSLIQSGRDYVKAVGGMVKLDSAGLHLTALSIEELIAQFAGRLGFWPELAVNAEPDRAQVSGLPCTVPRGQVQTCREAWGQLETAEGCLIDCWPHIGKVEFSHGRKAHAVMARMDSSVSAMLGRPA